MGKIKENPRFSNSYSSFYKILMYMYFLNQMRGATTSMWAGRTTTIINHLEHIWKLHLLLFLHVHFPFPFIVILFYRRMSVFQSSHSQVPEVKCTKIPFTTRQEVCSWPAEIDRLPSCCLLNNSFRDIICYVLYKLLVPAELWLITLIYHNIQVSLYVGKFCSHHISLGVLTDLPLVFLQAHGNGSL